MRIEKRLVVSLYVDELLDSRCQFRSQVGVKSPTKGFPQMGPWHHVGATMEITLDKNWTIIMIRWELNPETCNQYIYIYIYLRNLERGLTRYEVNICNLSEVN